MYIILLIFSFSFLFSNQFNRDFLNENPIHPLPQEMTFEEYQDLNRTISTGLLLSAIPILALCIIMLEIIKLLKN